MPTPKVDVLASRRNFIDHLAPIWNALPEEFRGQFIVGPSSSAWAESKGVSDPVTYTANTGLKVGSGHLALVASYSDAARAYRAKCRSILVEHGFGQSHGEGGNPSYHGTHGRYRDNVVLFINPGPTVTASNLRAYPEIPQATVGCPKLDPWHRGDRPKRFSEKPVVAVGFHWSQNAHLPDTSYPEAHGAFDHFASALPELVKQTQWTVIGAGHPLNWGLFRAAYEKLGVEPVEDFDEVLDRADLYVNDCSSTMYEFASLGRPVVVLNAPWYRRDVDLGMRFWTYANVGLQCDEPGGLVRVIERAFLDTPAQRQQREWCVQNIYAATDGHAAERAAGAIVEVLLRGVAPFAPSTFVTPPPAGVRTRSSRPPHRRRSRPVPQPARPAAPPSGPPYRGLNIVCGEQGWIVERMAQALSRETGWLVTRTPVSSARLNYYINPSGSPQTGEPFAAYYYHQEHLGDGSVIWSPDVAPPRKAFVRVVTAPMYLEPMLVFGPSYRIPPPLDRVKFSPPVFETLPNLLLRPVAGLSGRVYPNERKGQTLLRRLLTTPMGQEFDWRASGRNWPVPTRWYEWENMEQFYRGLDVYVCASMDGEGVPYPPIEALACGVPLVIPRHIGLLDELPDIPGIIRYEAGRLGSLTLALREFLRQRREGEYNREELREATVLYTAEGWAEGHRKALAPWL